jgi:hypothetical protein
VGRGDLADDRQAEARTGETAGVGGAVEAVEDADEVVVADSGAAVEHLDAHRPPARARARAGTGVAGVPRAGLRGGPRHHDLDRLRSAPVELGGVLHQVGDRPLEGAGTAVDLGVPDGVDGDLPAGAAAGDDRDVLGQIGEIEPPYRLGVRLAGREGDEFVDQVGQLPGLQGQIGDDLLTGVGRQFVDPPEHRDVRTQRGQRRAEFVSGVLDQAALVLLGLGEAPEHPVEGPAEPGHLVVPGDRHLDAEATGARHVLGGPGEPDQTPGDAPGQPPAEQPRGDHDGPDEQDGPPLEHPE